MPDSSVSQCSICDKPFIQSLFTSGKHHCRKCGNVVCKYCSKQRIESYRLCDHCYQPGATIIDYIYHSKYIPSSIADPKSLSHSIYRPQPQPRPHRQPQPQLSQSQSRSYSQLPPPSVMDKNRNIVYIQPVTNNNNNNNYDRINMNLNMNMNNMECIEYEPSNNDLLKDIEGQNSNDIQYKLSSSNSATSISYYSNCDDLSGSYNNNSKYCPDCDRCKRRKERKRQRKMARRARREYNKHENDRNNDNHKSKKRHRNKHKFKRNHDQNKIHYQQPQFAFVSYPI